MNLAGVKVLIVDDEEDARALVKRLLEDRGANVRAAGSAAEALALLTAQPPDVLVSDIGMPGEDGYALIRQVRQELTGDEIAPDDILPEADALDSRDEVLGQSGRHMPNMGPSDENTVSEKLVAEGMDEALHEEMREGVRKLDREDRGLGRVHNTFEADGE